MLQIGIGLCSSRLTIPSTDGNAGTNFWIWKLPGVAGLGGCGRSLGLTQLSPKFLDNREKYREKWKNWQCWTAHAYDYAAFPSLLAVIDAFSRRLITGKEICSGREKAKDNREKWDATVKSVLERA